MNANMKQKKPFAELSGRQAGLAATALRAVTAIATVMTTLSAFAQAPTITFKPGDYTTAVGSNVVLRVGTTGTVTKYTWSKGGFPVSSGSSVARLVLSNVTKASAGSYTIRLDNGSSSITSTPFLISVLDPVVITGQPAAANLTSGASVTLSATVTGEAPINYQWSVNGVDLAGATNSTLALTSFQLADSGDYRVKAWNAGSVAVSAPATVAAFVAPAITTQPANQTNAAGQNVTFNVAASGTAPLAYQWYFNNTPVGGAVSSALTFTGVGFAQNGGQLKVVVSNPGGSVTSSVASLTVTTPILPTITSQPVAATTNAFTDKQSFSVTATGTGTLSYQWWLGGSTNIPNVNGTTISSTLNLTNLQAGNAGDYSVVVSSIYGSTTSSNANLKLVTATAPNITGAGTNFPADITALEGGTVTFSSQLDPGVFPAAYQWYFAGRQLAESANAVGTKTPSLTLKNVAAGNIGFYFLRTTNVAGLADTRTAELDVIIKPRITLNPVSRTISTGSSVQLSVAASGTAPLSYQWRINDIFDILGATNPVFIISNAQLTHAASYLCVVSNPAGSAKSAAAVITVLLKPVVTTSPISQVVTAGANVTFTSAATGSKLNYQWSFNGNPISGANTNSLSLTNVTSANSGDYSITVFNDADSDTKTANLIVIEAPKITTQPVSQTVEALSDATFSVAATGGPLSYQWYFNNVPLSGATAKNLTIPGVTFAYSGAQFSVIVKSSYGTNNYGSVTSTVATLTVVPQKGPTITLQPANASAIAGGNATFSADATGSGTLTYQWYFGTTAIGGATGKTLPLTGIGFAQSGKYSVVIGNLIGSVTSQVATLTVTSPNVTGYWDFADGNLNAKVGGNLSFIGNTATVAVYTNVAVGGVTKPVLWLPALNPNQGLSAPTGVAANGGGSRGNQYTIIADMQFPAITAGYGAIYTTDASNLTDAALFIDSTSGIGVAGQFQGNVSSGAWHRITVVVDTINNSMTKYSDGVLQGFQSLPEGKDGRWSVGSTLLLLSDNSNDTQPAYLSAVQILNTKLNSAQVTALGAATGAGIPVITPLP